MPKNVMNPEEKINHYTSELNKMKNTAIRLEEQISSQMQLLKNRFSIDSVEEAEELLEKLISDRESKASKMEELIEKVEEQFSNIGQ